MALFLGADRARYGRLIESTEHAFLQKKDLYPKTVQDAYSLLTNYKENPRNHGTLAVEGE
jgi:hypothetical protein